MSTIADIKDQIDRTHATKIEQLALKGQARAVELTWRRLAKERYNLDFPMFTAKDSANLKLFLREYTNAIEIMTKALERWKVMRLERNLNLLGPMPTFGEFFAHRQKIYVWLQADKQHLPPKVVESYPFAIAESDGNRSPVFNKDEFLKEFQRGRKDERERQRTQRSNEK